MGKGNRNRLAYQAEKIEKESKLAAEKKKKKRTKKALILIALVCVLAIIVSCGIVILNNRSIKNGDKIRKLNTISTDHYYVDGAMMSYFIHNQYISYTNENSAILNTVGLNPDENLKDQTCNLEDTEQTWFSYFSNKAKNYVQKMLLVCEAADEAGYSLDDEGKQYIDSQLKLLRDQAEQQKQDTDTYISSNYGVGVKETDIRNALQLETLSSQYQAKYKNDLSFSDDVLSEFYKENSLYFNSVSYYTISFISSVTEDMTPDEIANCTSPTYSWASGLAECKTVDEFMDYMKGYYKQYFADRGQSYTDKDIQDQIDSTVTFVTDYTYSDTELGNWACNSSRKIGDTKLIEVPGEYKYEVYMIASQPKVKSSITKNFVSIKFSDETYGNDSNASSKAREVLFNWKKTDKTVDAFKDLAAKDNDESNHGIMENKRLQDLTSVVGEWVFDATRKSGDCEIVSDKDNSDVYLLYYIGDGYEEWKVTAKQEYAKKEYDKAFKKWQDQYKLTTNALAIEKLPG